LSAYLHARARDGPRVARRTVRRRRRREAVENMLELATDIDNIIIATRIIESYLRCAGQIVRSLSGEYFLGNIFLGGSAQHRACSPFLVAS
jgi:hypothetical protein